MLEHPAFLAIIAIAPAAAILAYYLYLVRTAPEPWPRVLACCVAGACVFPLAGYIESSATLIVTPHQPWAWAFGVVAPTEEILKLIAVLVAGPRPTRYERFSSGLMYGVAAGVGFACVENLLYVFEFGATTAVLRAATAVPSHALHSAVIGIGLGALHRTARSDRRNLLLVLSVGAAIALHGAYDGILLGAGKLRGLVVLLLAVEVVAVRLAGRFVLERDLQWDIDLLARMPLLENSSKAALRVMAGEAVRARAAVGSYVVRQGTRGDIMFVVLRGALEVRIDGAPVRRLGHGEYFGELSVLTGELRSADVVVVEEVRMLKVTRQVLLHAITKDAGLADLLVEYARGLDWDGTLPTAGDLVAEAARSQSERLLDGLAAQLAATPLLASLPADDLRVLAKACVRERHGPTVTLLRARGTAKGLCLLLSGHAQVVLPDRRVDLVEGDFFGEISLLTGWSPMASVVADSPVEIAVLRWSGLGPVIARNPAVGWRLLRTVVDRLADSGTRTDPATGPLRAWRAAQGLRARLFDRGEHMTSDLLDEFAALRSLPFAVTETLRDVAEPVTNPEEDGALYIGEGAGIYGPLGRFLPAKSGGRWWRLPDRALEDAVARSPDLLRFFARLVSGRRH